MGAFVRELGRVVPPRSRGELLAAGLSPRTLGSDRWRQVSHGWHVPRGVPDTVAQRVVQAATIVTEGCVSGWAAAYVLGADALDGRDPFTGVRQPVRLVLAPGTSHRHVPGSRAVRAALDPQDVTRQHGLQVTTVLRTADDLAREAPDLVEAVVALDVLVQAGLVRERVLLAELGACSGGRGARQARAAAALCRSGVRSPWETRLRLFVLGLGLPEPLVNVPVFDLDGNFLGAPDLLDVEAGLAIEFDGAGHRERKQHRADNVREEGFERGGLVVARADSLDLTAHRDELARRLRAAHADALRNRRPPHWTLAEPSWWRGMPA
ncbi:hypothetical protein GCM10022197_25790 [Microlunatus spumicola]|uniref:DUF559 domain-containing protein n=1 Tax=Microlunatus spumicola TaxID=81499 RepID=A0ABP6XQG3_9ACTN